MFHSVFYNPCKLSKMLFSLHFVLLSVLFVDSTTTGCISSNGVGYRGDQQISSTGQTCLNWTNTSRDYDVTIHSDSENGVGDHNYCRNPDSSKQPWCYVAGPEEDVQRRSCAIETCIDEAPPAVPSESETKTEAEVEADPLPSEAEAVPLPALVSTPQTQSFEPVKSAPAQGEGAAVQTVMGISQRVRTGPKKKKDLGTLGYVLGIFMMVIIILLGVGITVGYFYKRGRDLKKQHEQRVYEREMQRITLPLSAFSNPTCELVDENTIVITAGEQTPTLEEVEGGDPLMGPAGTPGA